MVIRTSPPSANSIKKPPLQDQWACLELWGRWHCMALRSLLKEEERLKGKDLGLTAVNWQVLVAVLDRETESAVRCFSVCPAGGPPLPSDLFVPPPRSLALPWALAPQVCFCAFFGGKVICLPFLLPLPRALGKQDLAARQVCQSLVRCQVIKLSLGR